MILAAEQLCVDLLRCQNCEKFFPWGWLSSFFNGKDPKFCPRCGVKKRRAIFHKNY